MRLLPPASLIALTALTALFSFPCNTVTQAPQERTAAVALRALNAPANVPETCRVTQPPSSLFVPPPPYPASPGEGMFWVGTEKLWTSLPVSGTWRGLQPYSPTTPGLRQKIFWWREGYDWRANPTPPLSVRGRRLDGQAPEFVIPDKTGHRVTTGYNEFRKTWFMLVGADIPTPGCWEITGGFDGDKLTFVIWVAP
jgi:hypothetical protein